MDLFQSPEPWGYADIIWDWECKLAIHFWRNVLKAFIIYVQADNLWMMSSVQECKITFNIC